MSIAPHRTERVYEETKATRPCTLVQPRLQSPLCGETHTRSPATGPAEGRLQAARLRALVGARKWRMPPRNHPRSDATEGGPGTRELESTIADSSVCGTGF